MFSINIISSIAPSRCLGHSAENSFGTISLMSRRPPTTDLTFSISSVGAVLLGAAVVCEPQEIERFRLSWQALPELLERRTLGGAGLLDWGYAALVATP